MAKHKHKKKAIRAETKVAIRAKNTPREGAGGRPLSQLRKNEEEKRRLFSNMEVTMTSQHNDFDREIQIHYFNLHADKRTF